jgi:hypothetical protein
VPIIRAHEHENEGDRDGHLPLFSGPAGRDSAGIAGLIGRLIGRAFDGCIILEQWPNLATCSIEPAPGSCNVPGPEADSPGAVSELL